MNDPYAGYRLPAHQWSYDRTLLVPTLNSFWNHRTTDEDKGPLGTSASQVPTSVTTPIVNIDR